MGERMRAIDWGRTAWGPIGTWSQALRTSVSICLSSRFPMILWWGPELRVLYNDAYIPMLGHKHPGVLGRSGIEAWGEIWDVISPLLHEVMTDGKASWSEDQLLLMRRFGFTDPAGLWVDVVEQIDPAAGFWDRYMDVPAPA